MQPAIKIVIADDQEIFLAGLRILVSNEPTLLVAGEACNGLQLLEMVQEKKPDIVITDIQMPEMDGIEAVKEMRQLFPEIPVIALTMYKDDHLVVEMLEAGAKGYLLKNTNKEELLEAIRAVHAGGWYFCNTTSLKLTRLIAASTIGVFPVHQAEIFTGKELEIVQLICQEYSSKQIGPMLHLSPRTVEFYRNKILEKTGAKNMAGIVIYAIKHGLFKVEKIARNMP